MGGGGLSIPMDTRTSQIYATEMPRISLARNATLVTALNFRPICQAKLSHRAHIHKRKVKTHTHKKRKQDKIVVYFPRLYRDTFLLNWNKACTSAKTSRMSNSMFIISYSTSFTHSRGIRPVGRVKVIVKSSRSNPGHNVESS